MTNVHPNKFYPNKTSLTLVFFGSLLKMSPFHVTPPTLILNPTHTDTLWQHGRLSASPTVNRTLDCMVRRQSQSLNLNSFTQRRYKLSTQTLHEYECFGRAAPSVDYFQMKMICMCTSCNSCRSRVDIYQYT